MDIFDLPTELSQLIVKELEREDVESLSRVSHAFRIHCEPVIFHRITLSDGKKRTVRINNRILKRLEDPKDTIARHVGHITVGYTSETATLPEESLSRAIRNLTLLESFTWHTWLLMPLDILRALEEAHPSVKIIVIAHERNNLALDRPLISSPQLHSLDIKLFALYDKNFNRPKGKSELDILKRLLIQGGNLKVLRLQFEKIKHGSRAARNSFQCYGPSEFDPVAFKFDDGDMLPALEELAIQDMFGWAESRTAVANTCRTWKSHQDWSTIRVLDLRLKYGELLLRCLNGSVPHLQTLKIMLTAETWGWPITASATLDGFLNTTHHLAHLHIEGTTGVSTRILQNISGTVASRLSSLYVQMDHSFSTWSNEEFRTFLSRFSKLQALALDGDGHQVFGAWMWAETNLPPESKLKHLVRTTREYASQRTFASRHARDRWYGSETYIRYPGKGRILMDYMPEPPDWLGFTENEIDEGTKQDKTSTGQLLEMFGLATAALDSPE